MGEATLGNGVCATAHPESGHIDLGSYLEFFSALSCGAGLPVTSPGVGSPLPSTHTLSLLDPHPPPSGDGLAGTPTSAHHSFLLGVGRLRRQKRKKKTGHTSITKKSF